eukprot:scaffold2723_cov61-Cylindrotheca_fusiformis.AAC.1
MGPSGEQEDDGQCGNSYTVSKPLAGKTTSALRVKSRRALKVALDTEVSLLALSRSKRYYKVVEVFCCYREQEALSLSSEAPEGYRVHLIWHSSQRAVMKVVHPLDEAEKGRHGTTPLWFGIELK